MKENRFISFWGGKNIIFSLISLLLLGLVIWIFSKVSFIFDPILIIIHTIIGPVVVAFILYYLLNPLVNIMEKYRIKRLWGIVILFLVIVSILSILVTLLVPIIQEQLTSFTRNLPEYLKYLLHRFNELANNKLFQPYISHIQDWVNKNLSDFPNKVSNYIGDVPTKFKSIFDALASIAVVIITFPFVLFFLLKDGAKFKRYIIKLTPPKYRDDFHEILDKMNLQVGSYIQGQLIVSICIGILLYIGYLIIGLQYALILACIAAVTSVVPYLGPMIAISPAVILALVESPFMLLKLAIVWISVQFLEGHFISPNIMGKTMQIHPLTIIFVLLCAGNLFGILGVIVAIPSYAILKVFVQYFFTKFKARYNRYYAEDKGTYE
ncbi:AI-2E family transporter [Macrococcus sp. DPC7161]|uniref:AI-2E family transporter n=1 Tax=Macrococcus sp. DPC7161 TaxID=2507060 RepID=UPI00100B2B0B|nr:AI-2E family transporter [Macrococcus sp. DPC7161]RXK19150.1 AI-2E family transporter [Macrococcus sp. DPC7161]